MTFANWQLSRGCFYPKTDGPLVKLRHDVLVKNGLVYRYSLLLLHDYGMPIEAQVVDLALEAGVPAIPMQVDVDAQGTYQWMRRARGEAVADLPLEQRRQAWIKLGAALRKLHTVKGEGAGLIIGTDPLIGAFHRWEDYMQANLIVHLSYAAGHEQIDEEQVHAIAEALIDTPDWSQQGGSLLHGDLSDHNLFTDGEHVDIIDWEDALIGDPVFELTSWACFHPEEEWHWLFDAYDGGVWPPDQRAFWLYYLRIALSRLVLLHRYGFPELGRAKERIKTALERLKA